jgi:hypothetical protein
VATLDSSDPLLTPYGKKVYAYYYAKSSDTDEDLSMMYDFYNIVGRVVYTSLDDLFGLNGKFANGKKSELKQALTLRPWETNILRKEYKRSLERAKQDVNRILTAPR